MHSRRKLLIALGASGVTFGQRARAQPAAMRRRIGVLGLASAQTLAGRLAAFRAGMEELHWVEGRDYVIDARYSEGNAQAAPALADELVATGPDLLLTSASGGARLLIQRTKTIPIVFALAQDPVGNGLAASLRRPGGNATDLAAELSAKRLQLLREVSPRIAHVALLFEPDDAGSVSQAQEIEMAAPRLGLRLTALELRKPADIEPAFSRSTALGAHAYIVATGGTANSQRQVIADRIIRLKVPAMFANGLAVEAGGLMSYATSFTASFRRAAEYVDKILKGANPSDLPIEQLTRFELVVSFKTAKAIGITLPHSVMLQVDRVIA
jgi:putative ABC transport system substrate-binding protein